MDTNNAGIEQNNDDFPFWYDICRFDTI
jgi:hypothetical protein